MENNKLLVGLFILLLGASLIIFGFGFGTFNKNVSDIIEKQTSNDNKIIKKEADGYTYAEITNINLSEDDTDFSVENENIQLTADYNDVNDCVKEYRFYKPHGKIFERDVFDVGHYYLRIDICNNKVLELINTDLNKSVDLNYSLYGNGYIEKSGVEFSGRYAIIYFYRNQSYPDSALFDMIILDMTYNNIYELYQQLNTNVTRDLYISQLIYINKPIETYLKVKKAEKGIFYFNEDLFINDFFDANNTFLYTNWLSGDGKTYNGNVYGRFLDHIDSSKINSIDFDYNYLLVNTNKATTKIKYLNVDSNTQTLEVKTYDEKLYNNFLNAVIDILEGLFINTNILKEFETKDATVVKFDKIENVQKLADMLVLNNAEAEININESIPFHYEYYLGVSTKDHVIIYLNSSHIKANLKYLSGKRISDETYLYKVYMVPVEMTQ